MPSNGTRKAKAAKAKAVEVSDGKAVKVSAGKAVEVSAGKAVEISAGSENGVLQEDKVVQPPNLTADDLTKMLKKLLEFTMLNEHSYKLTKSELENSEKKLMGVKLLIIPNVASLSDKVKNTITTVEIQQIELEVSALSATMNTLEKEAKSLSATFDTINQYNLLNQQHHCQPRHDTSNVIDIFDKIRCEVAAEKVAAEKVAAEKVAAEKVAADKAAADKAAADKVVTVKVVTVKAFIPLKQKPSKAFGPNTLWKVEECLNKKDHSHELCKFWHKNDCTLWCDKGICENSDCKYDHFQPYFPCTFGKRCNKKECGYNH